jgi:hypothetical protein
MRRLLTILLLAGVTAHGQIDNPVTASSATFATNVTVNGTLGVSNTATFATNVSIRTLTSVQTNSSGPTGFSLTLPDSANVLRVTNSSLIRNFSNGRLGAFYYLINQSISTIEIQNTNGITVQGGRSLTLAPNEVATLVATGPTNVSVAGRGDLTDIALGGTANTAPSQTASSGSSLMTRDLSDARLSPMPMTPQIVPWYYNGTLNVVRVTNGSATCSTVAAYPSITTTTNAADSGAMIMTIDVWGAVDSAANPWNAVGKSVIIQGRLASTATNAVSRYVWSSSTNWPLLITNVGTNGISNIGWAVETRNDGGSTQARLIVNGATNKSESAWTAIGFNPGNDSSFMVVGRTGSTSLYWAQESTTFSRIPLITVTNQIGGSVSGAFQGGLGFAVVNTNTAAGSSTTYIRRCYQVLGMTNYGY